MRTDDEPVITDFGLARCSEQNANAEAKVAGSPSYMSPEQVRCQTDLIGPATDVYGLGVMLYEMLTGQRLFAGVVPVVYSRVLNQRPTSPSRLNPAVDLRLDKICLRALSKSPADRFQSVRALRDAVAECLANPFPVDLPSGKPVSLQQPTGLSRAESLYQLESRCVKSQVAAARKLPARNLPGRKYIHRLRRWRWQLSRQRFGFAAGLVAGSAALAILGTAAAICYQLVASS